jgi:hypothetical protein
VSSHRFNIVLSALALRKSHAAAPLIEVFDIVMKGRAGQVLDFGVDAEPASEFGQLIAEAFDESMTPNEWAAFTGPDADTKLRTGCLSIWRTYVLPRFAARYGVLVVGLN